MTKQQTTAAVVGLGALLLYWMRPKSVGTVTTSEGFDLSPYGGMTNYPQPIVDMSQAIAHAEGFYLEDSIPSRAHNPGDLKLPGYPTLAGTSITRFDGDDQGFAALQHQLWIILTGGSDYYDSGMSIADMARVWTTTQQTAWAQNVASYLGVPTSTPLWQVLT